MPTLFGGAGLASFGWFVGVYALRYGDVYEDDEGISGANTGAGFSVIRASVARRSVLQAYILPVWVQLPAEVLN